MGDILPVVYTNLTNNITTFGVCFLCLAGHGREAHSHVSMQQSAAAA